MHRAHCAFIKHSFWNRDRLERGSGKKVPGVIRGWPARHFEPDFLGCMHACMHA